MPTMDDKMDFAPPGFPGWNGTRTVPDGYPRDRYDVYDERTKTLACLEGRIPEVASGREPRPSLGVHSPTSGNLCSLLNSIFGNRLAGTPRRATSLYSRPPVTANGNSFCPRPSTAGKKMASPRPARSDEDLFLVPVGSETAVPTVRGIIEEHREANDYSASGRTDERTPVYQYTPKPDGDIIPTVTPKKGFLDALNPFRSAPDNTSPFTTSNTSPSIPPKAKALLGSPTILANELKHSKKSSPITTASKTFGSLKRSASQRAAGLLSPASKFQLRGSPSLARTRKVNKHNKLPAQTSSPYKPRRAQQKLVIDPKAKSHFSMSTRDGGSLYGTPASKMNGSGNKSPSKSPTKNGVQQSPTKSPTRADASQESSGIVRMMSNAAKSLLKTEPVDKPPTPPEKDTPPSTKASPSKGEMKTAATGSAAPAVDHSGAFFYPAEAPESGKTVTSADLADSPTKKMGYVHRGMPKIVRPASEYRAMCADICDAESIAEELASPPMPTKLFHSPRPADGIIVTEDNDDDRIPAYDTQGLVAGKFLPATVYKPQKEAASAVYSPSVYTVQTADHGDDAGSTPVPPNSPEIFAQSQAATFNKGKLPKIMLDCSTGRPSPMLKHSPRANVVQHKPSGAGAPYVPAAGETPVIAQDFATIAGARKHSQASSSDERASATSSSSKSASSNGTTLHYEHPSARPVPLRFSRRREVSAAGSLRERFSAGESGLGIDLSDEKSANAGDEPRSDDNRAQPIGVIGVTDYTYPWKGLPLQDSVTAALQRQSQRLGRVERSTLSNEHLIHHTNENIHALRYDVDLVDEKLSQVSEKLSQDSEKLGHVNHKLGEVRGIRSVLNDVTDRVRLMGSAMVNLEENTNEILANLIITTVAQLEPRLNQNMQALSSNNNEAVDRILHRIDKVAVDVHNEIASVKKSVKRQSERLSALETHLYGSCGNTTIPFSDDASRR